MKKTLLAGLLIAAPLCAQEGRGEAKQQYVYTIPYCSVDLAPGTLCRWIPLSVVTINLTPEPGQAVTNHETTPYQVSILLPKGMRQLYASIQVQASPTGEICSTDETVLYSGDGGLAVECQGIDK